MNPLVVFILHEPGMADRLLAQHVADGTGHCRACPLGGQAGHHKWPCTIHAAAVAAQRHAGRTP